MRQIRLIFCVIVLSIFSPIFLPSAQAGHETITGTLTRTFRVITDKGQSYYITTKGKGNELAFHEGRRITVQGQVEEISGEKLITVTDYFFADDGNQKTVTKKKQSGSRQ